MNGSGSIFDRSYGFMLHSSAGYNNGVLLLNQACKTMYSNSSLGAIGRSIKIEDIEAVSKYDKTTYSGYGDTLSCHVNDHAYPIIYKHELGEAEPIYNQSDQDQYFSGYQNAGFSAKRTYYTYVMTEENMNSSYLELLRYQPGTITNFAESYWIASRCVDFTTNAYTNYALFSMFYVSNGTVNAFSFMHSFTESPSSSSASYAIRPVVEIDLSKASVGATGTGTSSDPYSITAK